MCDFEFFRLLGNVGAFVVKDIGEAETEFDLRVEFEVREIEVAAKAAGEIEIRAVGAQIVA